MAAHSVISGNTANSGNSVDFESKAYRDDQRDRLAIKSLRSSTRGMRERGIEYLPKEDKEQDPRYKARLGRSFLFAALDDTIDKLVAKPFAKEVTIKGKLPEKLEPLIKNVDQAGTTLSMFAKRLFDTAVGYGLSHVFVDFQKTDGKQTRPQELAGEFRPYFVFVDPTDLIGWKTWTAVNGETLIVELRWRERRQETDGKYGTKEVNYIRVVRNPPDGDGTYELHRQNDNDKEYTLQPNRSGAFNWGKPGLPFFTHYTDRVSFLRANPPMRDLMWKNIEHWQKSSDLNQALRFAALIMLMGKGMPADTVTNGLPLAHGATHMFKSDKADLKWVEAKGTSIKVLEESIDKLHEEMEVLGKSPLLRKTAFSTATSVKSSDDKNEAPIQVWVRDLTAVLLAALDAAGEWIDTPLPDKVVPHVFDEFKLHGSRGEMVKELREIRKMGEITPELFLTEIQKHGYISDDVDIDKEVAKVLEEKERMAALFAPNEEEIDGDPPGGGDDE